MNSQTKHLEITLVKKENKNSSSIEIINLYRSPFGNENTFVSNVEVLLNDLMKRVKNSLNYQPFIHTFRY